MFKDVTNSCIIVACIIEDYIAKLLSNIIVMNNCQYYITDILTTMLFWKLSKTK